jgi:hypothetical protein
MRQFLKSVLRTRCMQRANMENDGSISTAEADSLMSEIYGELYEEVADAGSRHFETSTTFTTSGAAFVTVPTDQLAMVDNLEWVIDAATGRSRRLKRVQPQERAAVSALTGDARWFEPIAEKLYLYPTPAAGQTVTLRYIPQSPDLTVLADGAQIDVVCAAGEAFFIWGVAAIAKSKDERFVDFAESQKEKARERLEQWARNRAFHDSPRRIVDSDDDGGDWREDYY